MIQKKKEILDDAFYSLKTTSKNLKECKFLMHLCSCYEKTEFTKIKARLKAATN